MPRPTAEQKRQCLAVLQQLLGDQSYDRKGAGKGGKGPGPGASSSQDGAKGAGGKGGGKAEGKGKGKGAAATGAPGKTEDEQRGPNMAPATLRRLEEEGWTCGLCGKSNFSDLLVCFSCKAAKGAKGKPRQPLSGPLTKAAERTTKVRNSTVNPGGVDESGWASATKVRGQATGAGGGTADEAPASKPSAGADTEPAAKRSRWGGKKDSKPPPLPPRGSLSRCRRGPLRGMGKRQGAKSSRSPSGTTA